MLAGDIGLAWSDRQRSEGFEREEVAGFSLRILARRIAGRELFESTCDASPCRLVPPNLLTPGLSVARTG